MSDFGFSCKGNAGNLIIGPDHPVLSQYFAGDLFVTRKIGNDYNSQGVYSCSVTYPWVVKTVEPPMVFAVPNGKWHIGGIGRFSHLGTPGNWTGFRMIYIDTIRYETDKFDYGHKRPVGHQTGWSYRVCGFDAPPSNVEYGMRMWDKNKKLIFDSGWTIIPFRGLLKSWAQTNSGGYYAPNAYWGNSFWNSTQIDDADRYGLYQHAWGVVDGRLGVLVSQLCAMIVRADTGDHDTSIMTFPMIGFLNSDRTYLYCSLAYGTIQHAGTAGPALNTFGLLTADFSKT